MKRFDSNNIRHIIANGSLNEIRKFHEEHFHEIKHTESFGLLLNRLEFSEDLVQKFRNKVKDLYNIV